jgi:hypothetical protein
MSICLINGECEEDHAVEEEIIEDIRLDALYTRMLIKKSLASKFSKKRALKLSGIIKYIFYM